MSRLDMRRMALPDRRVLDLAPTTAHPAAAPGAAVEPHALYDVSKRAIDVVLALAALVVALPVLLAAAAAIVLTTRENPLFLQRRVGRHGRPFDMLKLRTMKGGNENAAIEHVLPGEILVEKAPDDGRVTRVGHLLRRTSLDELPQLINVLAGQMSLVGPRPGLPVEAARYPVSWRRRLAVKPGLTGLWQVSGRGDVPAWRRTAMDRYYIRRRSLGFDAAIILRTFATLVSMRGAW